MTTALLIAAVLAILWLAFMVAAVVAQLGNLVKSLAVISTLYLAWAEDADMKQAALGVRIGAELTVPKEESS